MLLGAALLTGLLTGCKQNEGERCQIDDDCTTGFYCQLNGLTREAGGYCRSTTPTTPATVDMTTVDMATKPVPAADMTVTPPDLAGTD